MIDTSHSALLDALSDAAIVTDGEGLIVYWNPAAARLLGHARDETLGKSLTSFLSGESADTFRAARLAALETPALPEPVSITFLGSDNTPLPVELTVTTISAGDHPLFLSILQDQSRLQHLETQLRESEARYLAILDNVEDGYFEVDLAGNIVFFNEPLRRMLGYPREEFQGINYKQFMDEENSKKAFAAFNKVFASGKPARGFCWELIRKDGARRYGETSISIKLNEMGTATGFRGIARDITQRMHAEEALRESEERLRMLMRESPLAIGIFTPDGTLIQVNQAWEGLWGIRGSQVVGSYNLMTDESIRAAGLQPVLRRALAGEVVNLSDTRFDASHQTARDEHHWVRTYAYQIKDVEGQSKNVVLIHEDVTERKRYEQERDRLINELNAFAHTVAHDLKNPLGQIVGRAETMKDDLGDFSPADILKHLRVIARSGRKMASIIDDLLLLAGVRDMQAEMVPLDMESITAEALGRVSYRIERHGAEIVLPETWPTPLGYGPWVEEILVNYLSNAIKYGGRPPHVELGASPQPDGTIRFWVRDNGAGIPHKDQGRLFTPFTRLDHISDHGHGLGLSIVLRIVERLGGKVGVESTVGKGSVFSFTLPASRDDTPGKD